MATKRLAVEIFTSGGSRQIIMAAKYSISEVYVSL
jgi:hypothetical protein